MLGLDDRHTFASAAATCGSTDRIKSASVLRVVLVRGDDQLRLSDRSFELLDFGLGFWKDFATLG
jgi:hypothetical protein